MPFNDRSRLDPSQVEDRRGRRVGPAVAIGGGGLGLVVLVVALLLGIDPSSLGSVTEPPPSVSTESPGSTTSLEQQCQTGADANAREDCRIVGFVNSIQSFWTDEFARRGTTYTPAKLVLFTDATEAACGYASAAVGPFYCPNDQQVYLDLSFFEELRTRFGAQGEGPYVRSGPRPHGTPVSRRLMSRNCRRASASAACACGVATVCPRK